MKPGHRRNILVAGGTGLVGANLVRKLHAMGAAVWASYFAHPPSFLKECFQRADLTQWRDCQKVVRGMQDVICCAAQTGGISGIVGQSEHWASVNLQISLNLLEACRIHQVERIVVISSSTVYPELNHPIREEDLDFNLLPAPPYELVGEANRFLERACRFYTAKRAMRIGILRPSNIYGPYDHFDEERSHVLPALLRRAIERQTPFKVWGNPSVVRDFIYVDDVVEAILKILEGYCIGDPMNVGSGEETTIEEAARLILEICEHPVMPVFDRSQPTSASYRVLDKGKAEAHIGRFIKTNLREGLKRTREWYLNAK